MADPLLSAHLAQTESTRRRAVALAVTLWTGLGHWDDPDINKFVARVVPTIIAAREITARLADSYIAQSVGTRPAGVVNTASLRGVPVRDLYLRPVIDMRAALGSGALFPDALQRGTVRVQQLVKTDMQMAYVRQVDRSFRAAGVERFRRVPRGGKTCKICILAAGQTYKTGKLMPIHPGCDCGVERITSRSTWTLPDGDRSLLEPVLDEDTTSLSGSEFVSKLNEKYTRLVAVREHGEVGPMLTWRDQHFARLGSTS